MIGSLLFIQFTLFSAPDGAAAQIASAARQRDSIQVQRESVRRQIKMAPAAPAAFFVATEENQPHVGDCAAISPFEASGLTLKAARQAGIDPNLLHAVVSQESAWKPCAVSEKGALGLAQLMPGTAAGLGVTDPLDPVQNLAGGAALLKQLLTKYGGDLNRVLGAYNAGASRVDAANSVPKIPETLDYVEKIMGKLSVPAQ